VKNERARSDSHFKRNLFPAALLVGLFQGLVIVQYDVLMGSLSRGTLLRTVVWLTAIVAAEVLLWWGLSSLLSRWVPDRWAAAAVVVGIGLLAASARLLLDDRTLTWAYGWLVVGIVVALVPLPDSLRHLRFGVAGLAIAGFTLLGRIPDFSFPLDQILKPFAIAAAVATILTAAALRTPIALGILGIAFIGLGPLVEAGRPVPKGPNILWVLVDTVRRDHVSPFGADIETPAIARLADEGVAFENAVTVVPKTPSSVASYFTGLYPIRHGVRGLYDHLVPTAETVAETMSDAGYETSAFVNNAWLSRGRGFAQGFERYHGYHEVNAPYGPLRYLASVVFLDRVIARRIHGFDGQTSAKHLTDRVQSYLDRKRDRPFFAYVHYFEPHWPYLPPEHGPGAIDAENALVNRIQETDIGRDRMVFANDLPEEENEKARELYRAEIVNTMAEVGRLIEHLDAGPHEDTIVIFSADHGHSLGEHEYYFHHGEFIYDASIQVPLVMRWPGRLPAGKRVRTQARSIDIFPTLLELCGLRPPGAMDGASLTPMWTQPNPEDRTVFLESDVKMFQANHRRELPGIAGKQRGLRNSKYKVILSPLSRGPAIEFYDLENDPGEEINLAQDEAYKELVAEWSARLSAAMPRHEFEELSSFYVSGGAAAEERTIDPNEERLLRSLGYIQ